MNEKTKKDKNKKMSFFKRSVNMNFEGFEDLDFADEMFRAIEKDHGEKIERITKYEEFDTHFLMTIIFKDYTILDAKIKVVDFHDVPSIQVHGTYH